MKAILDELLFVEPALTPRLIRLFSLAQENRHRLEIDPIDSPVFRQWLGQQHPELQTEYSAFLDQCFAQEDQEPAKRIVLVGGSSNSNWERPPPKICLDDAIRLFKLPFKLVLEDRNTERMFLRCVMTPSERVVFDGLENDRIVEIEHGGGTSQILHWLEKHAGNEHVRMSSFVLCDSDALYPGIPGDLPEEIGKKCEKERIPFHRLERRFIESYIPQPALRMWAEQRHPHQKQRQTKVEHFFGEYFSERKERRYYFNMKGGFQKDAKHRDRAKDLYDGIPEETEKVLWGGFGKEIKDEFKESYVTDVAIRDDGSAPELRELITRIFALLR